MIHYIKQFFFNRCIKKHKSSRKKTLVSLEQVKTIAILCQIGGEDSYKEVYDLFSKLHSPKRSAWLMGYIEDRNVPYYCLPQLSADYFSKKNLNWFGKPDFVQLHDFLDKDFDILIDFSRNDLSPLRYILSASKAKLIIGANEFAQDYYDIYIKDETQWDYLSLLKTIHNYLLKLTGKCNS
jgi:6-phosphofructokinase